MLTITHDFELLHFLEHERGLDLIRGEGMSKKHDDMELERPPLQNDVI